MRQKLAVTGFSYLLGLIFASVFLVENAFLAITAVILLLTAGCICCKFKKYFASVILICTAIGAAVFAVCSMRQIANANMISDGGTYTLTAKVTDKSGTSNDISCYYLESDVNGTDIKYIMFAEDADIESGDTIQFAAVFSRLKNSTVFSSAGYYMSKGIFLSAVLKSEITVVSYGEDWFVGADFFTDYKEYIARKIDVNFPDSAGALMKGIFLGDKSAVTQLENYNIQAVGAAHLTAVSGMHFTLIIHIFSAFITALCLGKFPRIQLSATIVAIFCFMMFFGFTASVLRAGIMLIIHYTGIIFFRKSACLNSIGLALLIILIPNPLACTDTGLVFSALTTIGAGELAPTVSKAISQHLKLQNTDFSDSLCCAVCCGIISLPLSMIYFGTFSVTAAIISVVCIPFFTISLVFLLMFTLSGGTAEILLIPSHFGCTVMNEMFEFTASIPFLHYECGSEITLLFVCGTAAIVTAVYFIVKKHKTLYCCSAAVFSAVIMFVCLFANRIAYVNTSIIPFTDGENGGVLIYSDEFSGAVLYGQSEYCANELKCKMAASSVTKLDFLALYEIADSSVVTYTDFFSDYTDTFICETSNEYSAQGYRILNRLTSDNPYCSLDISADRFSADIRGVKINVCRQSDSKDGYLNFCWGYSKNYTSENNTYCFYFDKKIEVYDEKSVNLYYNDIYIDISDNGGILFKGGGLDI